MRRPYPGSPAKGQSGGAIFHGDDARAASRVGEILLVAHLEIVIILTGEPEHASRSTSPTPTTRSERRHSSRRPDCGGDPRAVAAIGGPPTPHRRPPTRLQQLVPEPGR